MLNAIRQIHSGDNGNLSWLRVASSFVLIVIMVTYAINNIINHMDFGTNSLYIITALLIAKVSTKQIEKKNEEANN